MQNKTTSITFRTTPEQREKLRVLSEVYKVSMSRIITAIVDTADVPRQQKSAVVREAGGAFSGN